MTPTLDIREVEFHEEETHYALMPDEDFFKAREQGNLPHNTLPLPEGLPYWRRALFRGQDVHAGQVNDTLYMLVDSTNFGYCLFKYVSQPDNDNLYRVAFLGGNRLITKDKEELLTMAKDISEIAKSNAAILSAMNLSGGVAAPAMAPVVGEGVTRSIDTRRLQSEIVGNGYVFGYVMASAPATTMALVRKKTKGAGDTTNIVAKESKPSRCLAVLMALPANCVQKGGLLASPQDLMNGMVEYTEANGEMIYQAFSVNAAISYIAAVGNRLPEYAPFAVEGRRTHWTPQEILGNNPEVTFVYVHASQNRSRNSRSQDQFRFSLKSTSDRRSLYTEKNHVCLRALEHIKVDCKDEKDAYIVNESAFGAWRYRKRKQDNETQLQRAIRECPMQIWETEYNVDGVLKKGIGSAFFMAGSETTNQAGEKIARRPLTMFRWYETGARRPQTGSMVTQIVKREFRPAEGDRKEGMVTKPIYYKDNPNHPMFRGYEAFVNEAISLGFLTREKLYSMGSRASKSKRKTYSLTPDQRNSLQAFLRQESVMNEIQSVRDEVADRAVIREAEERAVHMR